MRALLAALARRNQAVAAPYAQAYADANRLYTVAILRPSSEPAFNRQLGLMVQAIQTLVFNGTARIRPISAAPMMDIGDGPTYWEQVLISIGLGAALDPQIDDVLTVTGVPAPGVTGVLGKNFRVIGVGQGGHLATGFDLTCSGIAPSRFTYPAPLDEPTSPDGQAIIPSEWQGLLEARTLDLGDALQGTEFDES